MIHFGALRGVPAEGVEKATSHTEKNILSTITNHTLCCATRGWNAGGDFPLLFYN